MVVEQIVAAMDILNRFPLPARQVPEHSREDLRELVRPPYRIVYRRRGWRAYRDGFSIVATHLRSADCNGQLGSVTPWTTPKRSVLKPLLRTRTVADLRTGTGMGNTHSRYD